MPSDRTPLSKQALSLAVPSAFSSDHRFPDPQALAQRLRPENTPLVIIIEHPHPTAHAVPPYHRVLRPTCYPTASNRALPTLAIQGCPADASHLERLGAIVLSTGLLAQLQTPEEFSFVVAHEIAHSILNSSRRSALLGQEQQRHAHAPQEELLADQLALELLGNEPRAAAAAHALILRLAQQEVARPQLEQRLAALASHGD